VGPNIYHLFPNFDDNLSVKTFVVMQNNAQYLFIFEKENKKALICCIFFAKQFQ